MKSKNTDLERFGQVIKEQRLAVGLSQEDLAAQAGVHRNYMGGLERGQRNPSLLILLKIAAALNTSPAALIAVFSQPQETQGKL